ncbi:MAG: radical SAM protein [Candidatus Margulisiibacteriota bacterium]
MSTLDCVLVYPVPTQDSPAKGTALSIFFLGAALEEKGYEVEYVDERIDSFKKLIDVMKDKPLCVGVSSMTGVQLIGAERALRTAKKLCPQTLTILGGVHASIFPEQCIKEDYIDFVVVGEGEITLRELVKEIKGNKNFSEVKGIWWKKDGKIIQNLPRPFMDLKDLPYPVTKKSRKYYEIAAKTNEIIMPTSRGCPHKCSFCYNLVFHQRRWRPMPIDRFREFIFRLTSEFQFNHMLLSDDNISANLKRIEQVGEVMQARNLTWDTSLRCDYCSEENLKALEKGGCRVLLIGVETGSERILQKVIGKDYKEAISTIKTCVINVSKMKNVIGYYSFMCNTPTETRKELLMSMDLADWIYKADKKCRISFFTYAPYPGTEIYQIALKEGFNEPKNIAEWSQIGLSNKMDPIAENLFYISGLRFRGKKGDTTSKNFPGAKRLLILPFELLARLRWKTRFLGYFNLEKFIIKRLFRYASRKVRTKG